MEISDSVITAFIASIAPTLGSIATLYVSIKNGTKVDEVHKATNSMKDALVATTRSDALQEGRTAGLAEARNANAGS